MLDADVRRLLNCYTQLINWIPIVDDYAALCSLDSWFLIII